MRLIFVVLLTLVASPVFAQQAQIPPQTQKIMDALVAQRNSALNAQAVAEATQAITTDELNKALDRIKELEKKLENKPKE